MDGRSEEIRTERTKREGGGERGRPRTSKRAYGPAEGSHSKGLCVLHQLRQHQGNGISCQSLCGAVLPLEERCETGPCTRADCQGERSGIRRLFRHTRKG